MDPTANPSDSNTVPDAPQPDPNTPADPVLAPTPAPASAPGGWDLSNAPAPAPTPSPVAPAEPAPAPTTPAWMAPLDPQTSTMTVPAPAEPAPAPVSAPSVDSVPTDLSQLVDQPMTMPNMGSTPAADPNQTVPSAVPTDVTKVINEGEHKSIPVWIWVVGGIVLLLVIGASAYFILGIGQSAPAETTSIPAEQTVSQQPPLTNPPAPIIQPSVAPITGTSSTFGNLQATPSSSTATGSSAIDLLRQRQATGQ